MYYNYTNGVESSVVDELVSTYNSLESNDVEHKNPEIRTSTITVLDKYEHKGISDLVYDFGRQANNDAYGFHIDDIDYCQFNLYDEKDVGHYSWHIDFRGFNEAKKLKHRKITVIIQLSEPSDYEGGELQVKYSHYSEKQKTDMLQKGSVITFPSFVEHRVTPVTKGNRISLIGWIVGEPWK